MKNISENATKILKCIEDVHAPTQVLGESSSIMRDALTVRLTDMSASEIHAGLLDLVAAKIITYDSFSGLILIIQ